MTNALFLESLSCRAARVWCRVINAAMLTNRSLFVSFKTSKMCICFLNHCCNTLLMPKRTLVFPNTFKSCPTFFLFQLPRPDAQNVEEQALQFQRPLISPLLPEQNSTFSLEQQWQDVLAIVESQVTNGNQLPFRAQVAFMPRFIVLVVSRF